ncbi:MAG: hypothetical protein NT075_36195 [Chloroflexi bacterium]|nr:hypothetical protein [Chloroflexota bacterium]
MMNYEDEKMTPLRFLREFGLGGFLLGSFLFFCWGTLFLMTRDPNAHVIAQPTPGATLVYSGTDGRQPSQPLLNRRWMVWSGYGSLPSDPQVKPGIFAYDFITKQRKFLDRALSVEGFANVDTIYYQRFDELYAYNLKTNAERLLINFSTIHIPRHPSFNGTQVFWTEGYPASCLPEPTCQQQYDNVCRRALFSYDLQTKKRQNLGLLPQGTTVSQSTATKLILYTPGGGQIVILRHLQAHRVCLTLHLAKFYGLVVALILGMHTSLSM